jgi:phosphoenolpyruvate-protein kinase (PTS system EI component)
MISRVATRAHGAGKQVAVCGEMAARPELAIALLALGVDTLSVTPRVIPELKQSLARIPLGALRASVDTLLAISSAEGVEAALRRYVRDGERLDEVSKDSSAASEAKAALPSVREQMF